MPPSSDLTSRTQAIAQAFWDAFPDVAFPTLAPIGKGYWETNAGGHGSYYMNDDGMETEAFFRGRVWDDCIGETGAETATRLTRFMRAPPPAKRWTAVVGEPLLAWTSLPMSLWDMMPAAQAYYLPGYLLTALPLLAAMPMGLLPWVEGRPDPLQFLEDTIRVLIPPVDLAVWEALPHLPPERLVPTYADHTWLSDEEAFLRFVGQLTKPQCCAVRQWVLFALAIDTDWGSLVEMEALRSCWAEPTFA